jgi:DNA-binding winged helix-turn-helix (wHTH) protein/Tfp pilus assembly protein PilF
MPPLQGGRWTLRFGSFEVDRAGELRKNGARVRLRGQPLHVLQMLVARPGEIVTREALRRSLWPEGTFVDFDASISAAVRRLRAALDDQAAIPRFVETIPGQGYRFIQAVQVAEAAEVGAGATSGRHPSRMRRPAAIAIGAVSALGAVAAMTAGGWRPPERTGAGPGASPAPVAARRVEPAAVAAYRKGRYFWNQRGRSPDALHNAIRFFGEAVALDSGYAAPHAGLADAYGLQPRYSQREALERLLRGKEHALRALELDPSLLEARTALAKLQYVIDRDWKASDDSFRRALREDPGYVTAHHWYSIYLLIVGRSREAEAHARRAAELDPTSVVASGHAAWVLFLGGRAEEARARAAATLEMAPDHAPMYSLQGRIALQESRLADALAAFTRAYELSGRDARELAAVAHVQATLGRPAEARRIHADLQRRSEREFVPPQALVLANASVQRVDAAFTWLGRSVEDRSIAFYLVDLRLDPMFAALRADPRLGDLFRGLGLDPPAPS